MEHTQQYTPRLRDLLLLAVLRPHWLAGVAWWRLLGKKLRAQYRLRDAIASLPFAYERRLEAHGQADLALLADGETPAFCVHIHDDGNVASPDRAVASALQQSHLPSRVIVTSTGLSDLQAKAGNEHVLNLSCADAMHGLRLALEQAHDAGALYLTPLRADATLHRHALASFAAHCLREPDCVTGPPLLYADQEHANETGRRATPWLKPQWDARMALSQDYVSSACALPVERTLEFLTAEHDHAHSSLFELVLRLALGAPALPVRHVPRVAVRVPAGDWQEHGAASLKAIQAVLPPDVDVRTGRFGSVEVRWPLPAPSPTISVVVATRDKVELLQTCVDGLLHHTNYPHLEIIIADNDSSEQATLDYMQQVVRDPRVQVVRWPHPFNYSAINNFAASHATGEYLCLLNNDIEILHADWLQAMVREAAQPGIGAVGARLLYPDRSIQHAGVVIGMGNAAGHAHRALPEGDSGYFAQAHITRGTSAVTAACLLLKKCDFDAVGGLDEEQLAVAYNDIDLCLKLRARGLANIYTPAATLIHHESKSRGLDFSQEHLERYMAELVAFQRRWSSDTFTDPWHHPEMDRASEIYRAQYLTS